VRRQGPPRYEVLKTKRSKPGEENVVRKNITREKRQLRSYRRLTTPVIVATVLFAIGAITVLSRQADRKSRLAAKAEIAKTNLASQDVHLKEQMGQPQQLSADEAQKLAGGLKELVNQSTEGLVEVRHADGSVSVNLEDRFQSVTVARVNKDGSIAQSCVDNPKAAGAFFGIDPKLIDPTVDMRGRKAKVSPARSNN
jgi:hypothetical protein